MLRFKIDFYIKLILVISSISIISAYFIEYILGHQPCNLCLIERIPYGLSIILILINYKFFKKDKFLISLLILVFIFSFIISFYHFGIERGFFEESGVCGLKNEGEILSKEELLEQLNEIKISCKDVTFKIFGFSLTTINIIINIFLIILLTKIFLSYEKFKNKN